MGFQEFNILMDPQMAHRGIFKGVVGYNFTLWIAHIGVMALFQNESH